MATKDTNTTAGVAIYQKRAAQFADLISHDDDAMEYISVVMDANQEVKVGPLVMRNHLIRVLGDKFPELPVPGSEGGNNPDKYPVPGKKAKGSVVKDLFSELPPGKALLTDLDGISKALVSSTETPAKWKAPKFEGGMVQLKKTQAKLKQRYSAGLRVVSTAIAFEFQWQKLQEFASVKSELSDDPNDPQTYPVAIFNVKKMTEFKVMSIGAFLSLDLDAAAEKGGSYTDVTETTRRGAYDDESDEGIKNFDEFEERVTDVTNFLEKLMGDKAMQTALYRRLNDPAADHLIATIFALSAELDKITSKDGLAARAAKIEATAAANGNAKQVAA